jgi:hypothetical protein
MRVNRHKSYFNIVIIAIQYPNDEIDDSGYIHIIMKIQPI